MLRFRDNGLALCPCGQRTYGLCEECERPACQECAKVELVSYGPYRKVLTRLCPRCWFQYDSENRIGAYPEVWAAIAQRIAQEDHLLDQLSRRRSPRHILMRTQPPGSRS